MKFSGVFQQAGLAAFMWAGLSCGVGYAAGTPLAPPAIHPANSWQGKSVAVVRVLDRLDAHVDVLKIPVGTTAHFKSLDITPGRCLQRPVTVSPDAAGWLELHDTHPDGATYKGWMLAAEPGLGVFESAVYDVRMVRCEGEDVAPAAPALPTPAVPVLKQPAAPDPSPYGGDAGATGRATPSGGAGAPQGAAPATPEYGGEY
ncbi:hypothetical protein ACI01nite_18160 [Acetobacter cibinongensis]|uniref:DUF2155 domain-containing protein n=1 Tax=Acetobacter cibinongensis TaxID=146475 RepID=A0A0D6N2D9_9PROT|nr:DUF2155 domain-containing protein [Acetobacter cibinongensis]GAN59691.1 hypothetical protein Abci_007_094 [Acetobacter cibinongensis]GBQ15196.1 hypothetical protein AA0482_1153 [Acetobacter cibinongensis NRIC 0482]GEL59214.1 hypothetical protein ACI01nite_18160 [Acetobacter cibinongensis]